MKRSSLLAGLCLLGLFACEYDLEDIPARDAKDSGDRDGEVSQGDASFTDGATDAASDASADAADDSGGASGGGGGGKGGHSGKGGSSGQGTGGDTGLLCEADDLRCHDTAVEVCAKNGASWSELFDCEDQGCNPVSLDCNTCAAPLDDDGVLSCTVGRAEAMGDEIADVDTTDADDAQTGTCGGGGSPERSVEWIAPATDYWVIDTHGSDYDTVLYARDCACDGAEIACNNNAAQGSGDSELVARFTRGQRVALVVDGNAGDKGKAVLNAERVTCPSIDLSPDNLPATFVDKADDGVESYRFTPKEKAFYSIRVHGEAGLTLCMLEGARCGGPELACNTAVELYGAQVIRELDPDQAVTLQVTLPEDAEDNSFDLDIEKVDGATCADPNALDNNDEGMVTTSSGNFLTASCAPAGVWDPYANANFAYQEVRIPYTYSYGSFASCKIRVIGEFPSNVYLLKTDCGGENVACAVGALNQNNLYEALLSVPSTTDPQDYVLVVEYTDVMHTTGGAFGVTFECIA